MIRKDYKPKPMQQQEPPKRWHIAAMALLVVLLVTDWEATLTIWGL